MTTVAGTQVQGLSVIVSGLVASFIIVPKDGVPAGSPKPKKESPVSKPIFPAKTSVASAMTQVDKLGHISRNIILKSEVPEVFDART